jgi:hypothetical protein
MDSFLNVILLSHIDCIWPPIFLMLLAWNAVAMAVTPTFPVGHVAEEARLGGNIDKL